MKLTKILLSTMGAAALAFTFSACSTTASDNAAATNANKSSTAVVVSNQTTGNNAAPVSNAVKTPTVNNTPAKPESADAQEVTGELQQGKTQSLILYFGEESGDYAAYCFPNDSEAGRAILAACKDKEQCKVTGEVKPGGCAVPGLEADLSDSGMIVKVDSVKKLAGKK